MVNFKSLGLIEAELSKFEKLGIPYKKSLKKELLAASKIGPASEAEINELEADFGRLPEDYREFLSTVNGGVPDRNGFVLNGKKISLSEFFAVDGPKNISQTIRSKLVGYENRIPSNSIPIGGTVGGDLILMFVGGHGGFSGIYLWRHEIEAENAGNEFYGNVEKLTEDFSSLLASLV